MAGFRTQLERLARVDGFTDEDARGRATFIALGAPLGVAVSFGMTVLYAVRGAWDDAAISAALCVAATVAAVWWFRTHSFTALAHVLSLGAVLTLGLGATAHDDRSYLPVLALVPLMALFIAGSRVGLAWTGVTLALSTGAVAWLAVRHHALVGEPDDLPRLMRNAAVVPLVSLIAVVFQHSREQTIRRLHEARARAEAANQAKTRFLATISHDLRTPLNGILGTLELARLEPGLSATTQQHLLTIHDSGSTLVALINDLLDLSRMEAGRLELTPRPFNPRKAALQVAALHEARAKAKGLTLTGECDTPDGLRLDGDVVRLQQVLHNLVGNAVKFTERGGVALVGRVTPAAGGRWRLEATVRDTGRGLSPAEVEALFQPFTQARASDAATGSGLGLSICKALVEQMGGRLTVQSTPGQGSTFTLTVELPEADSPDITPLPQGRATLERVARAGRVLVVDDNAVNLKVAAGLLERLGLTVDQAASGEAALGALELARYDLVLMDLQMPGLDGAETTRRLRAREGTGRRTPVVALTASALPEELAACRAAGMDDTLTKPVQVPRLRHVIETWVPAP